MSSKQMVNVSEGICFRLANVVSLYCVQSEQTGLQISLDWRWRSTVSCWRWVLMLDLIIDALSASAMREGSMSKASLATPWPLSRKRDSLTFSGIWRFSFRKRRLWVIGTCLRLLQRSVRVWMLEAGLLDTALINSYNSFWLALLAKRSFFLLLKKGIFENLSSKQKKEKNTYCYRIFIYIPLPRYILYLSN